MLVLNAEMDILDGAVDPARVLLEGLEDFWGTTLRDTHLEWEAIEILNRSNSDRL